jgi:hypothetical protein
VIRRLLVIGLAALLAPATSRADDRDLEPAPPWIFFDTPDPETAEEIGALVARFDQLNRVKDARAGLVLRFGVLCTPRIVQVLGAEGRQARNEPHTWNAALTTYALRNVYGNARELWPLVKPLTTLLDEGAEPYRRAFSALSLGAFRGPRFAPEPPTRTDPTLSRIAEDEARKDLTEALAALARHVVDFHPSVRVASALALGKSGAPTARDLLDPESRLRGPQKDATVEARQAVLLAVGLLPGQDDEPLLLEALSDEQRNIRRAAALAVSLQLLYDHRPGWTNAPARMLRALKSADVKMHLEDGAEAVFARGVLAAEGLATPEWEELFTLAQRPSTEEETARAAAQCLLFCDRLGFPERVLRSVQEGVDLKPTVLAAFLLLLGSNATPEGIEVCRHYLSNRGLRPKGKAEWDVRYFAVVGLLRALAAGRLADKELRGKALAALEAGLKKSLQPGPFRTALSEVMENEQRQLTENRHYALPEARVTAVEHSFLDPHGLFARDVRDMAVVRLNDMVPVVFSVNSLKRGQPGDRDKTEIPRRFLLAAQEQFPYFTRLDLRGDRGHRPAEKMPTGPDPQWEVDR